MFSRIRSSAAGLSFVGSGRANCRASWIYGSPIGPMGDYGSPYLLLVVLAPSSQRCIDSDFGRFIGKEGSLIRILDFGKPLEKVLGGRFSLHLTTYIVNVFVELPYFSPR